MPFSLVHSIFLAHFILLESDTPFWSVSILEHYLIKCVTLYFNMYTAFGYRSRRLRKELYGGIRQAGIIAAAGIVALDSMFDRLQEDHKRANAIGKCEHYVTATMKGSSLDATGCLASHAIPQLLWSHVVHYRVKDSHKWLSSTD